MMAHFLCLMDSFALYANLHSPVIGQDRGAGSLQ